MPGTLLASGDIKDTKTTDPYAHGAYILEGETENGQDKQVSMMRRTE